MIGVIRHYGVQDRVTKLQEQAQQQKRRIEDLQRALRDCNLAEEKVWVSTCTFRHGRENFADFVPSFERLATFPQL